MEKKEFSKVLEDLVICDGCGVLVQKDATIQVNAGNVDLPIKDEDFYFYCKHCWAKRKSAKKIV